MPYNADLIKQKRLEQFAEKFTDKFLTKIDNYRHAKEGELNKKALSIERRAYRGFFAPNSYGITSPYGGVSTTVPLGEGIKGRGLAKFNTYMQNRFKKITNVINCFRYKAQDNASDENLKRSDIRSIASELAKQLIDAHGDLIVKLAKDKYVDKLISYFVNHALRYLGSNTAISEREELAGYDQQQAISWLRNKLSESFNRETQSTDLTSKRDKAGETHLRLKGHILHHKINNLLKR